MRRTRDPEEPGGEETRTKPPSFMDATLMIDSESIAGPK